MNDRKSLLPDDAGPPGEAGAPQSASRRRFARGAAPVVLGSLVSKPVLGAPLYHCTVSGHVSGDASPRADAEATCVIGKSRSHWLSATWGFDVAGLVKGDLPNSGCNWNEQQGEVKGTLFNSFGSGVVTGGLAATFYYAAGQSSCNVTATGTAAKQASLYQVLASTTVGELYDLGRATVVSLLNYYDDSGNYPVTAARIIHMFNATYNGGTYDFNATVSWDRTQVLSYLTSLYPPG